MPKVIDLFFCFQAVENAEEFKKKVFAVGFTDSVHVMPAKDTCDHLVQVM